MNWGLVLDRNAAQYPDKEAIVFEDRRATYREVLGRVQSLALGLQALGLQRGDVLAIVAYNCPEFIELTFAVNYLGAIWLPINWRLTGRELAYILKDSNAKMVVASAEFSPAIASVCEQLPSLVNKIEIGPGTHKDWDSLSRIIETHKGAALRPEQVGLDDIQRLMYTSGTTSHPKGVMISYGNLYWKCFDHILEFNLSPEDRCLVVMPLFHSGGMDLPATSVIYRGGTIVLNRKFDPLETIQAVVRERITHLLLTPSAVNRVLAERSFRSEDLRTLKVLVDGGEKMPMPLAEKIVTTMPELWFCNGFGMTETVTGDTFVPKEMIIEKIGSVGRAVAAVQVRIVDNDDRELPAGVAGEVVLRGPKVFKGYWRNPAATAEAFRNGWFHTGDIGYLDEDSYLYIVDRKKDIIISGGENISSTEVESVICELPEVFEAAVVVMPHPVFLEVPKAFVVLREHRSLDSETVIAHCIRRLAKFKVPKEVEFIAELPRNPQGKILKRELRRIEAERHRI